MQIWGVDNLMPRKSRLVVIPTFVLLVVLAISLAGCGSQPIDPSKYLPVDGQKLIKYYKDTNTFDYTENKNANGQTSRTFKAKGNLGIYVMIWGNSPQQIDRIDAMFPLTPGQQAMNKVSFMIMRSLNDHIFGDKSQAATETLITAMESSTKTETTHKFIAEGVLVSAGTVDFPGEGLLVMLSYSLPKDDDKQKYGPDPRPDPKSATKANKPIPVPQQSPQTNSSDQVTIIYSYGADNFVALSQNNLILRVGQKLVLKRDPNSLESLKTSRFMSSAGEDDFYGHFEFVESINRTSNQKGAPHDGAVFIAKKPGPAKLQIVPAYSDWDHAKFLNVTIKE